MSSDISLFEAVATARAVRRYTDETIPTEDLNTIMWHATRAPSGSNRQPFRFLILRDGPKAVQARAILGKSFRAGWAAKRSTDGYESGTGLDGNSPKARMAATMQHYVDNFEAAPVVILAFLNRYRRPTSIEGASVYPACQNLLLAARALGYGGVLTGWHAPVEAELRELFALPERTTISATITLGRPAGRHGPVRRLPLSELIYEDDWGLAAPWASDPPGTKFTAGPPHHHHTPSRLHNWPLSRPVLRSDLRMSGDEVGPHLYPCCDEQFQHRLQPHPGHQPGWFSWAGRNVHRTGASQRG